MGTTVSGVERLDCAAATSSAFEEHSYEVVVVVVSTAVEAVLGAAVTEIVAHDTS